MNAVRDGRTPDAWAEHFERVKIPDHYDEIARSRGQAAQASEWEQDEPGHFPMEEGHEPVDDADHAAGEQSEAAPLGDHTDLFLWGGV